MAVAEARAAWQRTANRCFVQEDAKRAPKLACCQSSSSTSKQADAEPASETDGPDHHVIGFMPLNRKPSYSNLPSDTRWWLQLQPGHGFQKGLTYEQINSLEADVEALRGDIVNSILKPSEVYPEKEDSTDIDETYNIESSVDEYSKKAQKLLKTMDIEESYELLEMDPSGYSLLKQSSQYCFDPESPWIHCEKTEPWWRTTDRDELASLLALKSLDHIENCDLPPPQNMHIKKHPCTHLGCFDRDELLLSSLDQKARSGCISNQTLNLALCNSSRIAGGKERTSAEEGCPRFRSDKSSSLGNSHCPTLKNVRGTQEASETDPSKAQLLEALRHSQTRAREAEKAAKQACAEKEHIIKLFFRQASQLFAYKQWFQLLQLETLYFKIKNSDQPISTLFPVTIPWTPYKGCKPHKNIQRSTKRKRFKRGQPRHDITKYAVAIALGLSLVGAGLLLGWTVGWMLPSF